MNKYKIGIIILLLLIIPKIAFADVGVIVKDHTVDDLELKAGEIVNVVKETEWGYTINHDKTRYQVPRGRMIRTTRSTQQYSVIRPTGLHTALYETIREIKPGETLNLIRYGNDPAYGVFTTSESSTGYVKLIDLVQIQEPSLTTGVSKVDKKLNNGNETLSIASGDIVRIKDYKDGKFIIVNTTGTEFTADHEDITTDVRSRGQLVSRGTSRRSPQADTVIKYARAQLGKPYVWGTEGPRTFDCSGYTLKAYEQIGLKIPRTSLEQSKFGTWVDKSELQPGDLVFFKTTSAPVGHVGIYIGDNQFIHASSSGRKVRIDYLDHGYYSSKYVNARRVIDQ